MKPREFNDESARDLINKLHSKYSEPPVSEVVGTVANLEDERQKICDEKASKLWDAVRALQTSVFLMGLYAIAVFFQA